MLLIFVLAAFCWTKSLLCNVADFTGMPYQFRVFKYSDFISLIWKGPYYDKISVTSVKKECLDSKKTLQSLQLSKRWFPSLFSEQPSETPGHLSVSNINNDAFNQGFSQFLEVFFRDMFLEDSAQIPSQRNRIPWIRPDDVIYRLDAHLSKHHPSRRRELTVRAFLYFEKLWTAPACIRPDVSAARSDATQCSTRYGFLSKTQIWEDSCNRLDDVDSRPDTLIHKASRAFKIQTFGRQSSWSGRTSYIYRNCVHQINCPDDHFYGSDSRSLNMKIACSEGETIRTTRQHRLDAAQIRKEFLRNFGKPIAYLSIQTPYDYHPDGA
jgi:hypothetical protein